MQNASRIRTALIQRKIYVPVYWPELRGSSVLSSDEQMFVDDILCLPIDQRYGEAEMHRIARLVNELSP
jgi:hypothetical protein